MLQIELESWDSWGPEDDRVMASNGPMMGHQRERRGSSRSHESESDPDVDYFQDMQPEIRKTAKVSAYKCSRKTSTIINCTCAHSVSFSVGSIPGFC